jgi:hypothetical protein
MLANASEIQLKNTYSILLLTARNAPEEIVSDHCRLSM